MTAPTTRQLQDLAACEVLLDAAELASGHWQGGDADADGVIQMPWFEHSPSLDAFHDAVVGTGLVADQRWMDWAGSERGRRLFQDPSLVAGASAEELVSLVTGCVRGDRFSEGTLAQAVESGLFRAILRRAADLADAFPADR